MRSLGFILVLLLAPCLFIGCGGSGEATAVSSEELQSYVEDNAATLAEEDAAMEAEEEAEDAEEDD